MGNHLCQKYESDPFHSKEKMQVGDDCSRELILAFASDNEEESEGSTPQPSQQRNLQVQQTQHLAFGNQTLKQVNETKFLDVYINEH
ncbi:unnamed protein product [Pocillopora meandrina]|uniref:Uncharacterized protein n=1 Tax=Pocillopora meandrina TaxID=46732 RepID=A0AAU9WXT3_9CNID|nr:unnamed protein product [Pocillopora meandrina]